MERNWSNVTEQYMDVFTYIYASEETTFMSLQNFLWA